MSNRPVIKPILLKEIESMKKVKTFVEIVTNIQAIGEVDSGKIIFTGSSLTGKETNRI